MLLLLLPLCASADEFGAAQTREKSDRAKIDVRKRFMAIPFKAVKLELVTGTKLRLAG